MSPLIVPPFSDIGGGLPPGPIPFGRRTWDNPVRYPLNRAYGTEFDFSSLADLKRRGVGLHAVADADLAFPGGSAIEFIPNTQGGALLFPVPAGDGEWVLEMSVGSDNSIVAMMFGLGILDSTGAGIGVSPYSDGNAYTWTVTNWIYAGSGNAVAHGFTYDNRHVWVALKKTGTSITGRVSSNGTSWTAYTAASTFSGTARYIVIDRFLSNAARWVTLHRLNFYPAPTYFPG